MGEKLPWELIEEILSRIPPKSLVCFKTVSKKWNALFHDEMFLNNHKSTFRFILTTRAKMYSVSIDPEVVVRELTLDIPGVKSPRPKRVVGCNKFLLCTPRFMRKDGVVVWNPWLNQTRVIKSQIGLNFRVIGYNSDKSVKENGIKIIAFNWKDSIIKWTTYDFATDMWKDSKLESCSNQKKLLRLQLGRGVSLNGKLYLIAYHHETDPLYQLYVYDVATESFFCYLPRGKSHSRDALLLEVFKGDRFSLIKQCHVTKKIEIWVTKNKISNDNDVTWMTFMEVSIPNLPDLEPIGGGSSKPSYFIDDKRLVICSRDETGQAWIYVMGQNKLISKTRLEYEVDRWTLHCTYIPSLLPVPQGPREEGEL